MTLSTTTVVVIAVLWRVFTATTTRTFFQPDEFFQSLEVAHHAVFGYGHLTWEWVADPPIRSIVFPSLYIPTYWILKQTGLSETDALIYLPKAFQGLLASGTDIATFVLAQRLLGQQYATTALFLSCTSFFNLLALGRTFSNSVETTLTAVALYFWPWGNEISWRTTASLTLAAISCMVRPTNGIIWFFLFSTFILENSPRGGASLFLIAKTVIAGAIAVIFQVAIDSLYFGRLTITSFNFLKTNISGVALFYGTSPWHYYLTQGLPLLCGTCLPYFLLGTYQVVTRRMTASRNIIKISALVWWTIAIYSIAGHKEWRFLHPILPTINLLSAKFMVDAYLKSASNKKSAAVSILSIKRSSVLVALLGLVPGLYATYFHSSSQIAAMHYFRSLNDNELRSVGFLMPCHSTPLQAYLHRPHLAREGYLWSIGCEPPLSGQNLSQYRDQSDIFYESPTLYLKRYFPDEVDPAFPPSPKPVTRPGSKQTIIEDWEYRWPTHLSFFGALLLDINGGRDVGEALRRLGYSEVWAGKSSFEEDWRRRGGVRIWKWHSKSTN